MTRIQYRRHTISDVSQLVESPWAIVQKLCGRKVFGELIVSRGDEKQTILEVLNPWELQDLVVIVDDLLADLFRWDINYNQILIFETENPWKLTVLSLCQVLYRQSLLLICLNWIYMNLDPLLLPYLLVFYNKFYLTLLESFQHLCITHSDQFL